ncbi:proteasome accessory factor PafA2 family protein [Mycobacterium tuberculosis]|uniref:proteasome accessory factor PafA2 family protein n=1 Tax=Mycobacterium tuberculosis TaxID=1773 RepID=UPI0015C5153A|nr:proteasome accessory factor PafA2 family protein [Mycobacterium tuberculosis]
MTWSCPTRRSPQLDLAYHDIKRGRGIFDLLQRKGLAARVTTDEEIAEAVDQPPQTTRDPAAR